MDYHNPLGPKANPAATTATGARRTSFIDFLHVFLCKNLVKEKNSTLTESGAQQSRKDVEISNLIEFLWFEVIRRR